MSGKQQFDDAVVIQGAMNVFWRRGYAAASIDELTAAMGLSRSSLYKRFRDKEGLYQEVLAHYNERVLRRMSDVQAKTRREQIRALLLDYVTSDPNLEKPSGCMLVKACVEISELPPGGRAMAFKGVEAQRALFRTIITSAVSEGELSAATDVEAMVWHYLGVLQAIMNLPQIGATIHDLHSMVASAMLVWPTAI
ncbi:TetR/AcrR family transcriptional regulator [Agrobacterium tumefaciens]|uniref:TetR/AcrR family transcriptional regulator n=1 Tax=Agrobacterium tumefaciens TaxID=358 RepID=UPI001574CDC7|nr:TetR/AcrR family transcriptional regulator [Agrobacterium tumefaciens]NTD87659.1 TetR/AcrR family transcriptional regulator [Agrobacterium tumefaciens]NTD91534.1 TetR/AcrR family transcriptional regulator [Agrobacterium tumefaciens]NTD95519.1 TetR/AcrR family transcriptional regulator [Agrobacterium tumefaciens]NTE11629.1 TetR/AcrR family transcriptional regulator [Agrobacterium tumefaciens]NTE25074.1 TetR/AcrR family transcriptional regulator [Agrobacterium tumefaciens]